MYWLISQAAQTTTQGGPSTNRVLGLLTVYHLLRFTWWREQYWNKDQGSDLGWHNVTRCKRKESRKNFILHRHAILSHHSSRHLVTLCVLMWTIYCFCKTRNTKKDTQKPSSRSQGQTWRGWCKGLQTHSLHWSLFQVMSQWNGRPQQVSLKPQSQSVCVFWEELYNKRVTGGGWQKMTSECFCPQRLLYVVAMMDHSGSAWTAACSVCLS